MAVKLFINYAEEDSRYWKAFNNHLSMLQRNGVIADYSSDKIIAGQVISDEMQEYLHSADIVLLLVSSDLIARNETYHLMKMAFKANKLVVPILVRQCLWKEEEDLAKLSVLPSNKVAIEDSKSRDAAYTHIIEELKKLIDHIKEQQTAAAAATALLLNKKYTCDRTEQRNLFEEHLEDNAKSQKVFFYVIQGEEIQSPTGLYQRLQGSDLLHNLDIAYAKTFEEEIAVEAKNSLKRSQSKLFPFG